MEQEIVSKVKETLAGALGVSAGDIDENSSLTRDLGAESIDFIDIIFRLEKTFEIKIPSGDLFPGNILTDERFVQNGRVTAAGMDELRSKMPYLNLESFAQNPEVSQLSSHFTVKMIVDYVRDRLVKDAKA